MHYEGYACASLEGAVFAAAQTASGRVLAHEFLCLVLIAVVQHRTVVAGQYDDCVFQQSLLLQGAYYLAHAPVELYYGIAAQSHLAGAAESLMWESGHVHVVGGKVHEEGFLVVLFYEVHGMRGDAVRYVLVFPQGLASALHVTYAPDAVHDGIVVSVRTLQIVEQFWIVLASRLALEVLVVVHIYRSRGVVVCHSAVLYEHARHTVGSGSHDVRVVKPYVGQGRGEGLVPVLFARLCSQS